MRIAYIVSMVNGLETFVKNEVDALYHDGIDISLFITKYKKSPGFEPVSGIKKFRYTLLGLLEGIFRATLKPSKTITLLMEAIKLNAVVEFVLSIVWQSEFAKSDYDVIHAAFGDRKFFVAYFLHRYTDIPLSVAIHAHEIYAQPNEKLFIHALKFTKKVVTISQKNKQLLMEKFSVQEEKIELIRLPIDTYFWSPKTRINVLTVARFTPRKGWYELVEAAKVLGDRFQFIAVGFGELDLNELAKSAGIQDFFSVFPKLKPDQIRVLMQSADVFCLPSKFTREEGSEGIPVALMEAMSMGLPIVSTSDGSIPELVDEILIEAGNVESLIQGISTAANTIEKPLKAVNQQNLNKAHRLHGEKNRDMLKNYFREFTQ